jgi:tRNA (mo5U34)-methyltransferase
MNDEQIKQEIQSYDNWFYQFDLKGNLTPVRKKGWVNQHTQRKRYFFDPLVSLFGGSLAGKRILDLGCNAGFWSLLAVENGCDFVQGIDGRQKNIDQANFVFNVKEIDKKKYQFTQGNVFDIDYTHWGNFNIVFLLGLIYHLGKPMELLERISKINPDILVIDTRLSRIPASCIEFRREEVKNKSLSSVDPGLVTFPTKQAVTDMAGEFGYKVAVLKPLFTDYRGANEYRFGSRRAFLCAKKTDLSILNAKIEKNTSLSRCGDLLIWLLHLMSRTWLCQRLARLLPERWRTTFKDISK